MSKRKYTKLKEIEPEIIEMRKAGMTRQEIADHFGLEKEQIKNWVNRYNHQQKQLAKGIVPRSKGRRSTDPEKEIERLRMENKLLRDFLQLSERM